MENVRKKNKPEKVKKTELDLDEVSAIIIEWGKGQGNTETQFNLRLPLELVQNVYDNCAKVQDLCDKLMKTENPPATEKELKSAVAVLGFDKSDEIVEAVIKYSDINNNGDWDMYKEFDWSTE